MTYVCEDRSRLVHPPWGINVPQFAKITLIAMAAFILPVGVVVGTRWDRVKKYISVSPADAQGHVLYFTTFG